VPRAQLAAETTCVQRSHALPDGRCVRLGAERFAAPEALFQPALLGVESPGLAELVFRCVQVGGLIFPSVGPSEACRCLHALPCATGAQALANQWYTHCMHAPESHS
jgi:hypothetical protein